MKKRPIVTLLIFAALGFALQLIQSLIGFEPGTGLARFGIAFLVPVLVLCLLWLLAVRTLPSRDTPVFPESFSMNKTQLLVPVAGVFALIASGGLWLMMGLAPHTVEAVAEDGTLVAVASTGPVSFPMMLVLGALSLVIGLSLLLPVLSCLGKHPCPTMLLFAPPVALVVRLVIVYRVHSVDPVVARYAVELLAMVALTMAYYRLSGCVCASGCTRRFALYAGWAVLLAIATLADGHAAPDLLFYLGNALTLLGLLQARIAAPVEADNRI